MKKIFIFLLLLCSIFYGTAYAKYDDTILFRDISWGKTIDEVEAQLIKDGFDIRSVGESDGTVGFPHSSLVEIMVDKANYDEKYGNYIKAVSHSPVKVAGYETYETSVYFAYLPNENDIITKDRKLTSFMLACYEIVPVDINFATEDIINKLKSIYGEYDVKDKYTSAFKNDYYIWKSSKDNTFIFLRKMESNYSVSARLYLYYGTMDGDNLMDSARQLQEEFAKKTEIENSQSSGTDGL